MVENGIFYTEWLRCLREHYQYVIRENDIVTQKSLINVMYKAGFTDDELNQLRLQATIRAEDVPDDFVPDLNILEPQLQPHPAECSCPSCMSYTEAYHDEEGQPLEYLEEPNPDDPSVFAVAELEVEVSEAEQEAIIEELEDMPETIEEKPDEQPQQLSLF
jgi:hypothetical protein